MKPVIGGDGAKGIRFGMFVVVDQDSPKPNTHPTEYKELAASAYTEKQAWENYNGLQRSASDRWAQLRLSKRLHKART